MLSDILRKVRPMESYLSGIITDFKTQGGKPKIPITSLPYLNNKLWGLREGELVVIGARTSQGKSSFVAQIALDVSDSSNPVLLLSLEMDVEDIIKRMFCTLMKVDNFSVIDGTYNKSEDMRIKFETFKKTIEKRKMLITCGIGATFEEVLYLLESMEITPKVVIVDYIQAIKTTAGQSREQTNEYIRQFRQLAIEKKFCGILVSQINRGSQHTQGKPQMWQLKETGCLEEHADRVLLLDWEWHRDKSKDKKDYEVIVAKNRNGVTGHVDLNFYPEYYLFEDKNVCSENDKKERAYKD